MPFWRNEQEPLPQETRAPAGTVVANVRLERKQEGRAVKIIVIDCNSGDTLLKAEYLTQLKTDYAAYNSATETIERYVAENGYFLQEPPTTNADLPSVSNVRKGSRWR